MRCSNTVMAGYTCSNMILLWLTLVTPYLLSGLNALPVTENAAVTMDTSAEMMTTDTTVETATIQTEIENSAIDTAPTNSTNSTLLEHGCNDANCEANIRKTVVNKQNVDADPGQMLYRDVSNQHPEPQPVPNPVPPPYPGVTPPPFDPFRRTITVPNPFH